MTKFRAPGCGGSPKTRASKMGTPSKIRYFDLSYTRTECYHVRMLAILVWKRLEIGTDMLLIITSTGERLSRFINIDDLERS